MESILKTEIELKILDLCERVLAPQGYRVIDLDCRVGGKSLLRIFIERTEPVEEGKTPTASIEDCARASRSLSTALDEVDYIPGVYDLEVSSPGVDRRLRLQADFERVVGGEVKLKLTESWEGRGANLKGRLVRVEDGRVVVTVQGTDIPIPMPKIKQANLVWQFK